MMTQRFWRLTDPREQHDTEGLVTLYADMSGKLRLPQPSPLNGRRARRPSPTPAVATRSSPPPSEPGGRYEQRHAPSVMGHRES